MARSNSVSLRPFSRTPLTHSPRPRKVIIRPSRHCRSCSAPHRLSLGLTNRTAHLPTRSATSSRTPLLRPGHLMPPSRSRPGRGWRASVSRSPDACRPRLRTVCRLIAWQSSCARRGFIVLTWRRRCGAPRSRLGSREGVRGLILPAARSWHCSPASPKAVPRGASPSTCPSPRCRSRDSRLKTRGYRPKTGCCRSTWIRNRRRRKALTRTST